MSGGYFYHDHHIIHDVAEQIKDLIENNNSQEKDEYGSPVGRNFPPEIIEKFKEAEDFLRKAYTMSHRMDLLLCGDNPTDSFIEGLENALEKLNPIPQRFIIRYEVTDEVTYSFQETRPIEYESQEAFICDFEDALESALNENKMDFKVGKYSFQTSDFSYVESHTKKKSSNVTYTTHTKLPDLITIDQWFVKNI